MIPLPKPRGLRDYTLFALVMSGLLMYLFWIEAGHAIRWADAALACAAAMLCVLGIILARRNEKASWLVQPNVAGKATVGIRSIFVDFWRHYADAYLLHGRDITASRFRNDIVIGIVSLIAVWWQMRRRNTAGRQSP